MVGSGGLLGSQYKKVVRVSAALFSVRSSKKIAKCKIQSEQIGTTADGTGVKATYRRRHGRLEERGREWQKGRGEESATER